jgi:hypothetical protein
MTSKRKGNSQRKSYQHKYDSSYAGPRYEGTYRRYNTTDVGQWSITKLLAEAYRVGRKERKFKNIGKFAK